MQSDCYRNKADLIQNGSKQYQMVLITDNDIYTFKREKESWQGQQETFHNNVQKFNKK